MKSKKYFVSVGLFIAFIAWTILVSIVDVASIGPNNSAVGFSSINGYMHDLIGVNMTLYALTDWLGLVAIGIALILAILGLAQLIKRKSILKVDRSLLLLGCYYIFVIFVFLFFERIIINYRPVLILGKLEASYPSSTTMLVLCVASSALVQIKERIKNRAVRLIFLSLLMLYAVFMVGGRVLSGVHWFSDIIGGVLISSALFATYIAACDK